MNHRFVLGMCFSLVTFVTVAAAADDATPAPAAPAAPTADVAVVASQFTDRIDHQKPVGDASAIAPHATATYWVDMKNPGTATQVTLVWKLDGKEAARQTLDVGRAPHWKTWGSCPTRSAHTVEVDVLDANGTVLKSDTATLGG